MQPLSLPLQEAELFGVRLHAGTRAAAREHILARAHAGQGGMVCFANVDMLTRATREPALAAVLREASAVLTDGMPLVWAQRHLQGLDPVERISGPSLSWTLCEHAAQQGLAVYLYGGTPVELDALERALRQAFPALRIAGAESPPLLPQRPPRDEALIERIRASRAGLVLVGLGCPKQEFWMQAHAPGLNAVCLGVGYAFALLGGTRRRAPAWMQRHGLEWLFRLGQDPRRLWRRYLVGNSRFLVLCLRAWLRRSST